MLDPLGERSRRGTNSRGVLSESELGPEPEPKIAAEAVGPATVRELPGAIDATKERPETEERVASLKEGS